MNGKDRVWNLKLIKKAFWAVWKSAAWMSWLVCLWATRRISSPKPSLLNCCTVYLQHLISLQMCCDKEWESSFWSEIWHKYTFPKRSICLLLTNAAHLGRFSFPFCCTAIAGHKDTPWLYCAHLYHTQKKQMHDLRVYLAITQDHPLQNIVSSYPRPTTELFQCLVQQVLILDSDDSSVTQYKPIACTGPSKPLSFFCPTLLLFSVILAVYIPVICSLQLCSSWWSCSYTCHLLTSVVFSWWSCSYTCHLLTSVVFQLMELCIVNDL